MKELSLVVLCYHSGKSILPFFHELEDFLDNMNIGYEIILVANDFADSKDETREIVQNLAETRPHVVPVTKIKKGMMGWDMIQGLNASIGRYICVIDGDGQFPVGSIRMVYEKIKNENLDLVKTFRVKRHDGLYRWILTKGYNFIFRMMFPGINSRDVNSKPKIMTRESYDRMHLQSTDWFIDAEIMIRVKRLKLKMAEVSVTFLPNNKRKSFVRICAIFEFMVNMIRYRFNRNRRPQ